MRKPISMNRAARIFTSGTVGAAMALTLGTAAPAAGSQAHPAAVTTGKFGLNAVGVVSPSDAWAVGESTTVLHWNGTTWARRTIQGVTGADLSAVDAVSSSDVWAAGFLPGPAGSFTESTLIVHWNGTTWQQVPSPGPKRKNVFPALVSISMDSATDGWAVGGAYHNQTNKQTNLALHWNGTKWQQVATNPAFQFLGVVSFSPTDALATGVDDTSGTQVPATFHWNGSAWSLAADLPLPSGVSASQVAGPRQLSAPSASDMWGAGGYFAGSEFKSLVWHWNGTNWTVKPLDTPTGTAADAVAAISPTDVWAVGGTSTSGSKDATWAAHWDGTNWTQTPTPNPHVTFNISNILLGVAAAGTSDVWAVGISNSNKNPHHPLILHWDGTSWTQF